MNFAQLLKKRMFLVATLAIFGVQLNAKVQLPYASDEDVAKRSELVSLDQSFVQFTTAPDGGYFTRFNPGPYTVESIIFGSRYGEGDYDVRRPKKAVDFETMEVVNWRLLIASAMVDIKKSFPGYPKYAIGTVLDTAMREIGVLDDEPFKGNPFVDAYIEGVPLKLTVDSYEHFAAIKKYLEKQFVQAQVLKKAQQKPLLVLEIARVGAFDKMTVDDAAFLEQYYMLCSRSNGQVKKFFEENLKEWYRAINNQGGEVRETVGMTLGEYVAEGVVKKVKKGKPQLLIGAAYAAAATWVWVSFMKGWVEGLKKDATKGYVDPVVEKAAKKGVTLGMVIGGASALAAIAALIGYVRTQIKKSERREKLLAKLEAAQQAALEQEAQEAAEQEASTQAADA